MRLKLLGSLLYALATLALFGAAIALVLMPYLSGASLWYRNASFGAMMTLFFPGLVYVIYTIGSMIEGSDQECAPEAFRRRLVAMTSYHDPLYWIRIATRRLRAR